MTIITQEEVIVDATRKSVVSFPEIAIRELLANAMIHQDLQQRGTNLMVDVFKNRIEFSNAGAHWLQSKELWTQFRYPGMKILQGLCTNVVFARNEEVVMIR